MDLEGPSPQRTSTETFNEPLKYISRKARREIQRDPRNKNDNSGRQIQVQD